MQGFPHFLQGLPNHHAQKRNANWKACMVDSKMSIYYLWPVFQIIMCAWLGVTQTYICHHAIIQLKYTLATLDFATLLQQSHLPGNNAEQSRVEQPTMPTSSTRQHNIGSQVATGFKPTTHGSVGCCLNHVATQGHSTGEGFVNIFGGETCYQSSQFQHRTTVLEPHYSHRHRKASLRVHFYGHHDIYSTQARIVNRLLCQMCRLFCTQETRNYGITGTPVFLSV